MGAAQPTSLLSNLQSRVTPRAGNAPPRAAAPKAERDSTASANSTPSQSSIADFEAIGYRSEFQRLSLSLQYQALSAQADENGEVTTESRQLQFDFAVEMRSEQLAAFRQRTTAAAEGMEGSEQTRFLAASRSLSARFHLSVTLSGETLNDFAGAAEALVSTGDPDLDTFMTLLEKLFAKDDDTLGEGLKMVRRFLDDSDKPNEGMKMLLDDLSRLGDGKAGTVQAIRIDFQLEFQFEETVMVAQSGAVQQGDPLVLDLDSDGIELTSYENGALFDLRGVGTRNLTAFVTGGDAFLAIDRNGNGRIDDGRELFGDQNGAANGFEELAKYDSNGDGLINALDTDFDKLLLFRDNGNGITEPGELLSLAQAGIAEIQLAYRNVDLAASGGNRIVQAAVYRRHDGTQGLAADVLLNYIA